MEIRKSDPVARRFVFGYYVRIVNESLETVQLLRRHWIIKDSKNRIREVEGSGVIGKQPVLSPGMSHEYSSYSVLDTFEGSMEGTYTMQRPDGEHFKVTIPRFFLRAAAEMVRGRPERGWLSSPSRPPCRQLNNFALIRLRLM